MADTVDKATRSRMMASISGKDTTPEVAIRKALFARGFRFRLHSKSLPGKPDIVLGQYRVVIFVNGCFWHWHGCPAFRMPQTRKAWWAAKLSGNRERDARNITLLREAGWRVCVIWECAFRGDRAGMAARIVRIMERFTRWIGGNRRFLEIGTGKGKQWTVATSRNTSKPSPPKP